MAKLSLEDKKRIREKEKMNLLRIEWIVGVESLVRILSNKLSLLQLCLLLLRTLSSAHFIHTTQANTVNFTNC